MSWRSVVDAWVDDITGNVAGMSDVIVHRYAPWSLENLNTNAGERHLAVWPEDEAESMEALVTGGGQLANQDYLVTVWEDAEAAMRLIDNEEANAEWLDLHEAIRARFFVAGNIRLGNTEIMRTRVISGRFPAVAGLRVMELRFRVQVPYAMA